MNAIFPGEGPREAYMEEVFEVDIEAGFKAIEEDRRRKARRYAVIGMCLACLSMILSLANIAMSMQVAP